MVPRAEPMALEINMEPKQSVPQKQFPLRMAFWVACLPPVNMQPDRGVLEDHVRSFTGTPCQVPG